MDGQRLPNATTAPEIGCAIFSQNTQEERIDTIYHILSENYVTFEETDDPWMTNGLSSTPFRALVSGCLSTVTVTKRVVNACVRCV